MRPLPAIVLVLFAIVLQVTALPLYRAGTVAPDFPFLALAYLALFAPPRKVLALAAAAAVGIDILSLDPLGTRLVGYLPALWLLGRFRRGPVAAIPLLRAVATLAACLAAFEIEGAFVVVREGRWLGVGFELLTALYTALLGVAAHAALDRYRPRLGWVRDRFFA
jgi:hypothetical protein